MIICHKNGNYLGDYNTRYHKGKLPRERAQVFRSLTGLKQRLRWFPPNEEIPSISYLWRTKSWQSNPIPPGYSDRYKKLVKEWRKTHPFKEWLEQKGYQIEYLQVIEERIQ